MSNLKLKVCGMRESENILAIDALGVDYLGFIFYPKSPRYISDEIVLPKTEAKKVGVFVNEMISSVLDKVQKHNIQVIQLHGEESVQTCQLLTDLGYCVIKAFNIDQNTTPEEIIKYKGSCMFFLYDAKGESPGGNGYKFDWQKLKELDTFGEYFLSGGISEDDVSEINTLSLKNMLGIDINSKFEIKPALKDEGKVQNVLLNLSNPK